MKKTYCHCCSCNKIDMQAYQVKTCKATANISGDDPGEQIGLYDYLVGEVIIPKGRKYYAILRVYE